MWQKLDKAWSHCSITSLIFGQTPYTKSSHFLQVASFFGDYSRYLKILKTHVETSPKQNNTFSCSCWIKLFLPFFHCKRKYKSPDWEMIAICDAINTWCESLTLNNEVNLSWRRCELWLKVKYFLNTLTDIIHPSICSQDFMGNISYNLEWWKYDDKKYFLWTVFSSLPKVLALMQLLKLPNFGTDILSRSVRKCFSTIFTYGKTLFHREIYCKSPKNL